MKFAIELSRSAKTGGELLVSRTVYPQDAKIIRGISHGRRLRMYDAAATTNLNQDFPVSIASANAEILTSTSAARSRARRLVRDNPYAASIESSFCNNVCGEEPFRLEMKVGKFDQSGKYIEENETNRVIETWWKQAGHPENCTVRRDISRLELYHQVIAAVIRDGGILARHHRGFPNNPFGYAIEPIEIDRLDHFWNRPAVGTANEIQFSIEMDSYHAPVAYWVLTRHPGDVFAWSNESKYRERIDAKDLIAFFNIRLRAGQYVGITKLAPVIQRLHRLDQYDIAEMTAAVVSAIKVGFFTKTNTSDQYVGTGETDNGMKIDRMEPGINFEEMPDNFDLKQFDPKHPVEAYGAFTDQNLRAVAQGTGLSHSALSGNYSGMSFSTGRLEKMPERDEFKKYQNLMKEMFVRPHFNESLKYAILSGKLKLPIDRLEEFQESANFHAHRWAYINPLQDAQADILKIEAGLDSRSRVIAESDRGGDVEQVDSEIASDRAVDEAHDLDFSGSDPTIPTMKKGDPGQQTPSADAPAPASKKGTKQTIKNKSRFDPGLIETNGNGIH